MSSFIKAFLLVFVAEMGDKSQLLSLAFATKYKLSTVMVGIALGIGLNHGLAIIAASFIANYLELDYIKMLAALVFLVFGLLSLKFEYCDEEEEEGKFQSLGPIFTIAGTFFIGELGDKTQIIAMTMGAVADNKLLIFLATFSSMMLVSIIGIFVGRILKKKIPEVTMNFIASMLFLFFGLKGFWDGLENFGISKIFILPVIIIIGICIFLINKKNEAERDKYFIREILANLDNCVGCNEEVCNCSTKKNIEELTKGYLGGDVVFIGNIVKYLESLKEISPKRYYKLYRKIIEEDYQGRVMTR